MNNSRLMLGILFVCAMVSVYRVVAPERRRAPTPPDDDNMISDEILRLIPEEALNTTIASISSDRPNDIITSPEPEPTLWTKYDRRLCTGLGDRLSIMLAVAALARSQNASCYFYWCVDNVGSHLFYSFEDISKYMVFPKNVVVLSLDEFNLRSAGALAIAFEGGELPAVNAYDGVYTLAEKTMILPNHTASHEAFLSAYRQVGQEWTIHNPIMKLPRPYIVLHLRQGDKTESNLDSDLVPDSSTYCTFDILTTMRAYEVQVVLISDDPEAKKHVLKHFGDIVAVPVTRGFSKIQVEMMDLDLLSNAAGIIQHVTLGWSAYSSTVAMAKGIPLVTTMRNGWSRLDDFREKGGCPPELMKCDQVGSFYEHFERHKVNKHI